MAVLGGDEARYRKTPRWREDRMSDENQRWVLLDADVWPWPGNTKLPWQVWNEVPQPDGMTIYDPDGFRFGRPTVVTWAEFEQARMECTMGPRPDQRRILAAR